MTLDSLFHRHGSKPTNTDSLSCNTGTDLTVIESVDNSSLTIDVTDCYESKEVSENVIQVIYGKDLLSDGPRKASNEDAEQSQKDGRCFQMKWQWADSLWSSWLEYSSETGYASCFACRQFGGRTWRTNKWKKCPGNTSDSLFYSHSKSLKHLECMKRLHEKKKREGGKSVDRLLHSAEVEKNRYYLKCIFDCMRFLVGEEADQSPAMDEAHHSVGLFVSLFKRDVSQNQRLKEIVSGLKKNALYTSPDVQNEIIAIMSNAVAEEVVNKIGHAPICLKADETTDRTGDCILSIVIRYVDNDLNPCDALLGFVSLKDRCAVSITKELLAFLIKSNIRHDQILCQDYDGASVMSGKSGGVQKLISNTLERDIPYIHCYSHKLHLVIMSVTEDLPDSQALFSLLSTLHCFWRKGDVSRRYEGSSLKRLLPQRWTGHYDALRTVVENWDSLHATLEILECDESVKTETRIEASGLRQLLKSPSMQMLSLLFLRVFEMVQPLNLYLQGDAANAGEAYSLVRVVLEDIKIMRENEDAFCNMYAQVNERVDNSDQQQPVAKRARKVPSKFDDSILTSSLPSASSDYCESKDENVRIKQHLRRVYVEVLDRLLSEFNTRFTTAADKLVQSVHHVLNAVLKNSQFPSDSMVSLHKLLT